MRNYIDKIRNGGNLRLDEIESVMHTIMDGQAEPQMIADFLIALREKGATVDEVTGAARIMRKFVVPIQTKQKDVLDTCGTGGDKLHTFNISTLSAFVVAGAGGVVAKHGNRAVSSSCGSACVLEGLGVNLGVEESHLTECLDTLGIAFLFAQNLHPAMKNVAQIRRNIKLETIFNLLGPLTNPAAATHQILGVYSRDLIEPMAHVLKNLGLKRAMVVHGEDGLDEITTTGKTYICEFDGGNMMTYDIHPEEVGIPVAKPQDLVGGDTPANVEIFKRILAGDKGPKRDIVILNAGYALYIAEKAKDITEGLAMAVDSIDSGKAAGKLEELVRFTNQSL